MILYCTNFLFIFLLYFQVNLFIVLIFWCYLYVNCSLYYIYNLCPPITFLFHCSCFQVVFLGQLPGVLVFLNLPRVLILLIYVFIYFRLFHCFFLLNYILIHLFGLQEIGIQNYVGYWLIGQFCRTFKRLCSNFLFLYK